MVLQHLQTFHPMHPCTLENLAPGRRLTVCTYSLHSTLHPFQPYQPLDTNFLYPLYSTSLPLDTVNPCTSAPSAPLCTSCTPTAIFFHVAIMTQSYWNPKRNYNKFADVDSHCWTGSDSGPEPRIVVPFGPRETSSTFLSTSVYAPLQ